MPSRMHTPLRKGISGGFFRKQTCSGHPWFANLGMSFANNWVFVCLRMELPEGISDGFGQDADWREIPRISRSILFMAATATSGITSQ